MKKHVVGRHEELGLHQSYKDFYNQKQLRQGKDLVDVSSLSGDESADNRIDEDDYENNLEFRQHTAEYSLGLFIHPMHDVTLDTQLNSDEMKKTD